MIFTFKLIRLTTNIKLKFDKPYISINITIY